MDQSLAVMLWQLCYGKISFIVLVPAAAAAGVVPARHVSVVSVGLLQPIA